MAFGFDDFAGLFDPISDVLGTSGKQGIGLLQQEPEDIQRAAMIAALVASGVGAFTAPAGATGVAAAGASPTLVTTAPGILAAAPAATEAAALAPEITAVTTDLAAEEAARLAAEETARLVAQESAQQGILQANQLPSNLMANVDAKGIDVASNSTDFLRDFGGREGALTPREAFPNVENFVDKEQLAEYGANRYQPSSVGNYGLNYTKPPVPEVGSNVSYDLTGRDTFRTARDTDLSSALPKSQTAGISNPTANVGNRLPYTEGDYTQTESALDKGMRKAGEYFDKALKYTETDPYKSAGLAYYTAYKTGMLDQPGTEAPKDNYKNPYNMSGFRRSSPNPTAYQYTPRYAEGGIASVHGYARGKKVASNAATDFTDFYDQMNARPSTAALKHGDPGIYYDADPDTRYLDPMEAAMVRMSKLNSRTNVQAPTMAPSRRMGELDFKPVAAAQGGIMGYADGGDVPIEEDEFNRLTGRGGGGRRTKAELDAKFSPTSEGAAAVSKFGQGLSRYPAMAPLGFGMRIAGALASSYGDHMARNVNPDYGNEAMNTSASKDLGLPSISADDDNSVVLGLGGGSDGEASNSNPGDTGRGGGGAHLAQGGGIMGYNLGGYAAGGNPRLLRGPGDGMSDHIPATINNRQPARLADGEYVITADVVSHLGNGSTEAGARQLDAMMKRIRKGRTGTPKQGKQINPRKYLPA